MCVKNKSTFVIRATFAASHFNMIDIRLNTCVNSTSNATNATVCLSPAAITSYLQGVSQKIKLKNIFSQLKLFEKTIH
jgi:hypothetical protein